jgi:hypothetical protein
MTSILKVTTTSSGVLVLAGMLQAGQVQLTTLFSEAPITVSSDDFLSLTATNARGTDRFRVAGKQLILDNRTEHNTRSYTLADGQVRTMATALNLDAVDSVLLELGGGANTVNVGTNLKLSSIVVQGGIGNNQFNIALPSEIGPRITLNGGNGQNTLKVSAGGQSVWASVGTVQGLKERIDYKAISHVMVQGANSLSSFTGSIENPLGMDVTNLSSNARYIATLFQQVLNRSASSAELKFWMTKLDQKATSRLRVAQLLLGSNEARALQVQSWYQQFLGRPASAHEQRQMLKQLAAGNTQVQVLSALLGGAEFHKVTQRLVPTGSTTNRYISGLYKMLLDPSGAPDNSMRQYLHQVVRNRGRAAAEADLLASSRFGKTQAEAISILIDDQPASHNSLPMVQYSSFKPNGLAARLLSHKRL